MPCFSKTCRSPAGCTPGAHLPSLCLSFPQEAQEHQHCFTSEGCYEPAHRLHGTRAAVTRCYKYWGQMEAFHPPTKSLQTLPTRRCSHTSPSSFALSQTCLPSGGWGRAHRLSCPACWLRLWGQQGQRLWGKRGQLSPGTPFITRLPLTQLRFVPGILLSPPGLLHGLSCLPFQEGAGTLLGKGFVIFWQEPALHRRVRLQHCIKD